MDWQLEEVLHVTGGRTRAPVVRFSRGSDGTCRDMIVKCEGRHLIQRNLCCEYFGNAIAREMGVLTPEPQVLDIDTETASAMNADPRIRAAGVVVPAGTAVGSEWLRPAPMLAMGTILTSSQLQEAARIYAFDLMLQQTDRLVTNPNILEVRGHFIAIDFETSCSFLFDILGDAAPWRVSRLPFVRNHFFRSRLTPESVDWRSMIYEMLAVDLPALQASIRALPDAWHVDCDRILTHIQVLKSHAADLVWEVAGTVSGTLR